MSIIYNLVDKFLMNDFSKIIPEIINQEPKKKLNIFDIGCFQGNFSRSLKKEIKNQASFYLFDANPNLNIKDFNYEKLAFSNTTGLKKFYLNTFFPSSGSSLNTIHAKDKLWNFTRKFITGNLNKQFKSIEVITETLDNYCKRNNIKSIDVLKIDTEGSEIEVLQGAEIILNNTDIILVEVLENKNKFKIKYQNVMDILEKKHNFKKIIEKKIWSLGTLSNMKAVDILFKK